MPIGKASYATESFDPGDILAGNAHVHDEPIVQAAGQNNIRGTVMGKITIGGQYVKSLAAAEDGSEVPVSILADDCDSTAAAKNTSHYLSGEFDQNRLTYGTGHTAATVKAAFGSKPLYLVNVAP